MASLLDWDLESEVFPTVRWLVHHRRAKLVDVVHSGLKTIFTLAPKFDTAYVQIHSIKVVISISMYLIKVISIIHRIQRDIPSTYRPAPSLPPCNHLGSEFQANRQPFLCRRRSVQRTHFSISRRGTLDVEARHLVYSPSPRTDRRDVGAQSSRP